MSESVASRAYPPEVARLIEAAEALITTWKRIGFSEDSLRNRLLPLAAALAAVKGTDDAQG